MIKSNFEVLIRSISRDVLVSDQNGLPLAELKCKRNGWLSNYYSGASRIENCEYLISCDKDKIVLSENGVNIGESKIFVKGSFERQAAIEINGEIFFLTRKDLKQKFEVTDSNGQRLLTITGRFDRKKQKNLFGLIYFDDKALHSVTMDHQVTDNKKKLQLFVTCGYFIRLFLEIDMGDFTGKIYR